MSEEVSIWEQVARAEGPVVVVTVAGIRGSVPGAVGGKAVVGRSGLLAGTLGGGKVEARAIGHAQELLDNESAGAGLVVWNLQRDIGMTCGGEMTFLFEPVLSQAPWQVVVFGAGHVGAALVRVLATLKCRVDWVDTRQDWLAKGGNFANVSKHAVKSYEEGVELVNEESFVVCVSQGHATDRPVLREVLRKCFELPFVGAIGSAAKRAVLLRELREDGIGEELLERLVCPLGLPIGGNDPAEIAVSITAQLLERRGATIA
ncbi:MAG: xanthine dehydrogenase accessory protein XdhC [Verrucomicrobiota bacterium]